MKLRVGLIGLGEAWEHRHRPALRALADRYEVRAVYDPIGHRAQVAASEFGAKAMDGFRAVAAREDVEAILVLDPQWYGSVPILAACDAGKAVYLGHSLPVEEGEIERIRHRVERAGVAFMAELLRRQSPATVRLKELIATRLGPPRLLFCHHRLCSVERGSGNPSGRPARSILQELAELVDWCCYVVAKPAQWVIGTCHVHEAGAEPDYQVISLGFSHTPEPGAGPVAQISCGRYFPASWQEAITYRPLAALQVCCERGIAFVDLPSTVIWFDDAGRHQESLDQERPVGEQLLTQFYRAVTSLVRKNRDLEELCRAVAIVRQSIRSYHEGRRIPLEG